jgi:hypothetical protein
MPPNHQRTYTKSPSKIYIPTPRASNPHRRWIYEPPIRADNDLPFLVTEGKNTHASYIRLGFI